MEKERYILRIYRKIEDDFEEFEEEVGDFVTYAVSKKQAFNNICYKHGLRDKYTPYESITYHYKVIEPKETTK